VKFSFSGTLDEFNSLFRSEHVPLTSIEPVFPAEDKGDKLELLVPREGLNLPHISADKREKARAEFVAFTGEWVDGFGDETAPQPDRLSLIQSLGQGPHVVPLLVLLYERGSLQRFVGDALDELGILAEDPQDEEWLAYIDLVSANMVQVSHMGFPDLAGTYDYSTKWRKK